MVVARPGTVRLEKGALYVNGRYHKNLKGVFSSLDDAILHSQERVNWPVVRSLAIKKVWDWMTRLKGFDQGIGEGRAGRAMAALSYLAIADSLIDNDLDIVWALMGLEAIYCHGSSGVMNQLLEKCQLLLGPLERNKKILSEMYNLRSRVVHGNFDLPVRYSYYDSSPKYEKFHLGTYRAALLAQVMLVATIQQLIERDLTELNFKHILDV
jgi:hypothetical protein